MGMSAWKKCLETLETELDSRDFNTWILPLQADERQDILHLLAPNRYILNRVAEEFMGRIGELLNRHGSAEVRLDIGSLASVETPSSTSETVVNGTSVNGVNGISGGTGELNRSFTFKSFVAGQCNEIAHAAAMQVAEGVNSQYNPLLLYGGVGLGKTHLMHAIGNAVLQQKPQARVVYMYAQSFMDDMVKAVKQGTMSDFGQRYRSIDVLLMDDVQFLANRMKSQEEFFHIFNNLREEGGQVVLTCDRYPKEIDGLQERLSSRFIWGLTAAVEPPELETRVAILVKKAELEGVSLPTDVAFFVAERVRSNVRELEGALKRVIANAKITDRPIGIEQCKQALRDMLDIQDRQISVENIKKVVAEYYGMRVSDMMSKKRSRTIARPRQVAMSLSKELTSLSLPEIGECYGGRDHTTVLHACRKVEELRDSHAEIGRDYESLLRILTS